MKLLVDAQLPPRLARDLSAAGHDVTHSLDLPRGNQTTDEDLMAVAMSEGRVLVTKDSDFVASFWLRRRPRKLLLISTGNISNDSLSQLISSNLQAIEKAFARHDFVELSQTAITIHD